MKATTAALNVGGLIFTPDLRYIRNAIKGRINESVNRFPVIEQCDTEDLRRIRMTWTGIEMKDSGKYECNATHMLGGLNRTLVSIEVHGD